MLPVPQAASSTDAPGVNPHFSVIKSHFSRHNRHPASAGHNNAIAQYSKAFSLNLTRIEPSSYSLPLLITRPSLSFLGASPLLTGAVPPVSCLLKRSKAELASSIFGKRHKHKPYQKRHHRHHPPQQRRKNNRRPTRTGWATAAVPAPAP